MARQFDKPLEDMTRDELFTIAVEMQIKGRDRMKRADLIDAILEVQTRPEPPPEDAPPAAAAGEPQTNPFASEPPGVNDTEPPGADGELGPDPNDPRLPPPPELLPADHKRPTLKEFTDAGYAAENYDQRMAEWEWELVRVGAQPDDAPESDGPPTRLGAKRGGKGGKVAASPLPAAELTEEDKLVVLRASNEELEAVLQDPASTGPARAFVEQERDRRQVSRKRQEEQDALRSPVTQYRITSGPPNMRYVTREGFMTQLPVGSVIGPFTHDLRHLSQAGFTWEKIKGVEVTRDQLGNEVSTAK